jgi:hypothetical protein
MTEVARDGRILGVGDGRHFRHPIEERLDGRERFQTSKRGPRANMGAGAESEVLSRVGSIELERIAVAEHRLVAVRRDAWRRRRT